MPDARKNFAYSTVATAPNPPSSGTSLVVASGHGSRFPAPPFNVTIWPAGTQPTVDNAEIARVTAISTDTLTIVRAQEGTSARSVQVGDQIAATITAKALQDLIVPSIFVFKRSTGTVYVLKSANSDLSGGADFNKVLSPGTETANTIAVSVAASATEDSFGFTAAGEPGTNGLSGDFFAEVNVTAANGNIFLSIAAARVNSSGVQQAISSFTAEQSGTAGVHLFNLVGVDLGTWASGDRLKIVYRFRNNVASIQSITIQTGTVDTEVDPAWQNRLVVPVGVTKLLMEYWGGGAGGAGANDRNGGGGGGAGAYGKKSLAVTPSEVLSVMIGAGGVGTGLVNSVAGRYTKISRGVTALGLVNGGGSATFGNGSTAGDGGLGGTADTADFGIDGQSGKDGNRASSGGIDTQDYGLLSGGNGGDSPRGGPGGPGGVLQVQTANSTKTGIDGKAPGGGGGGGCGNGSATGNGGSGAEGAVVAYY